MARLGRSGFLAIAVVFHLIYVYSIFDIYFVSPIVSGMREFSVDAPEPPAKRLVLFVGDGLRADKAFQSFPDPSPSSNDTVSAQQPRPLAPFLRSRVLEHGTFGVSYTRVPTESRPGHVALIAGLYEDVSAVSTGWKLNPVNFDSVFNRSRHTWSWGSPDILPMFKEGAVPGRVDAYTYGAEAEDFTQDATHLDTWVFERAKGLFEDAKANATLDAALREDKNVFFLHLLGLDMTGHAYRPYSREYLHNIKVVDKGVQEITELVENFYGDGKTAFVFTADHGMSDWGSHGDGHPDNTRTPLVVWGAGVARPVINSTGVAAGHEDGFSSDWNLDHIQRNDVAQADVAALMAYLAGLPFPVNSVGELPLAYVEGDLKTKAEALLVNAREILEMYHVKEEQKKSTELRYRPFQGLGDSEHSVEHRVAQIRQLIDSGDVDSAIKQSDELIQLGLAGLRYLQTYDWLFLRALVSMGYLGWIAYAITTVIDLHVLHGTVEASRTTASMIVFSSILVALYSLLFIQHSSWTYYAYAFFPVMFWEEIYARRGALVRGQEVLLGHLSGREYFGLAMKGAVFVGLLEALVQSYFHREIFTVCYLLAIAWPVYYGMEFLRQNKVLVATWTASCASMSVFTLLPAVKVEDIKLILIGGFLMFMIGVLYLLFEKSILVQSKRASDEVASISLDVVSRTILGVQTGLIALAMFVTRSSVRSLQAREGLSAGTQIVGWLVLVASLTIPFLHGFRPNNHYLHRLVTIFLSFSPIFVILTISYEGLFYFAFSVTLVTWVRMEHRIHRYTTSTAQQPSKVNGYANGSASSHGSSGSQKPSEAGGGVQANTLPASILRTSLFLLYLLQSAFFSTGNIASISSFSLDAVYRLIPIFDPFSQAALLIFKLMVPFAVISAILGILSASLGLGREQRRGGEKTARGRGVRGAKNEGRVSAQPGALFTLLSAIGDYLTVRFFWMVRDEGSWLEIGTGISHFCIASALCVFVAGLEGISGVLIGDSIEGFEQEEGWAGGDGGLEKVGEAVVEVTERPADGLGRDGGVEFRT